MGKLFEFQKKAISSNKLGFQIVGALLQWRPKYFWVFVLIVIPLSIGVSLLCSLTLDTSASTNTSPSSIFFHCIYLVGINLILWITIKVCRILAEIFSLKKQDSGVTWCYISILVAIGLWIIAFVLVFNTKGDSKVATAIAIVGGVISMIFKDKIAGVVAFLHLRMHHLLKIGDWIMVPQQNVDGEVKRVTLTSVTIYNWDTTTSVIPISALHSGHFKNLQNMCDGKTYGRRMYKSFILDTGWFHPITAKEIESIVKHNVKQYLPADIINKELNEQPLNAHLYRLYLYHWLMAHPHISHQPRLIVRWMDQVEGGMPLQVYAFIVDSSMAPFEWQQSEIIEHVIESMDWFGLRLYQTPSAYDVSNSNIFMTDKQATYRKEDL